MQEGLHKSKCELQDKCELQGKIAKLILQIWQELHFFFLFSSIASIYFFFFKYRIYFNREIVLNSSYFISHNMSASQLSQARFPLSHWDQDSSTLGIPQLTLTQRVVASVLYTASHLRREQLSSLHHHESPFSNRKQLCTCKA